MKREVYTPAGGPPQIEPPNKEIYNRMGRDEIFRMLADVYLLLGKSTISEMFPKTEDELLAASQKSAAFFVQIVGGPDLFAQTIGSPQMRSRHLPFAIDEAAREEWLRCFYDVLEDAPDKYGFPEEHLEGFKQWLANFSAWLVNRQ